MIISIIISFNSQPISICSKVYPNDKTKRRTHSYSLIRFTYVQSFLHDIELHTTMSSKFRPLLAFITCARSAVSAWFDLIINFLHFYNDFNNRLSLSQTCGPKRAIAFETMTNVHTSTIFFTLRSPATRGPFQFHIEFTRVKRRFPPYSA